MNEQTVQFCARLALETWRSGPRTVERLGDLADHYATTYGQPKGNVRIAAFAGRHPWEITPRT